MSATDTDAAQVQIDANGLGEAETAVVKRAALEGGLSADDLADATLRRGRATGTLFVDGDDGEEFLAVRVEGTELTVEAVTSATVEEALEPVGTVAPATEEPAREEADDDIDIVIMSGD